MRITFKTVVIIFSVVYSIITLVTMYRLYNDVIVRFKSDGKLVCRKRYPFAWLFPRSKWIHLNFVEVGITWCSFERHAPINCSVYEMWTANEFINVSEASGIVWFMFCPFVNAVSRLQHNSGRRTEKVTQATLILNFDSYRKICCEKL